MAQGDRGRRGPHRRWARASLAVGLLAPLLAVAPSAAAEEREAPRAPLTPIDLGTLVKRLPDGSKPRTDIIAIDGDLVLGYSGVDLGTPTWDEDMFEYRPVIQHPFVYDLGARTPRMVDLTRRYGIYPRVAAVGDGVVVGSYMGSAYALDLNADRPRKIDLGSLNRKRNSVATAVDDGIVVGHSWAGDSFHAFAYDLNARSPKMIDLGTFDPPDEEFPVDTEATAVDDGVVAGHATMLSTGRTHAWAYDLNAAQPRLRDLGTLGGSGPTRVSAVDGDLVVGYAMADEDGVPVTRPFVADLSQPDATMTDLAPDAEGDQGGATDVASGRIISATTATPPSSAGGRGVAWTHGPDGPVEHEIVRYGAGYGGLLDIDDTGLVTGYTRASDTAPNHVFTYDLGSPSPRRTELGVLRGGRSIWGLQAQHGVMTGAADRRALVWPLTETLRLARTSNTVSESARVARVHVVRTGEIGEKLRVDYSTGPGTAQASRDYRPVSGTLTFAPGESAASFRVPIRPDAQAERAETIGVRLSNPTGGVRFLGGSAGRITIAASDQRPDVHLSTKRRGGFVGNDVYNLTGRRQTKAVRLRRGGVTEAFVRLQHDGNAPTAFTLRRPNLPSGVQVRYFAGKRDVTQAVASRDGWQIALAPGRARVLRMEVRALRRTSAKPKAVKVVGTWSGDRVLRDAVRLVVRVGR